jgi:hypothetical protein
MIFKRSLRYTMCSHRLPKPMKINKEYDVIKTCSITALQDIQKTFNIIRNQIDAVDAYTKWAALKLMLASSACVPALVKKMTKLDTKTVMCTNSIPKIKVIDSLFSHLANPLRTTQVEQCCYSSRVHSASLNRVS